jgi:surface polysaccharide O-acyltransferase-like enzyme
MWKVLAIATAIGSLTAPHRIGLSRLAGIDLMRLVSFVAVVLIHAVADGAVDHPFAADVIAMSSRFAVPFFFLAFGYLLSPRRPERTALRLLFRLAPPFLFWAIVYILYFQHSLASLKSPAMVGRLLITGLDGQHLWFLPALGAAGVLFAVVQNRYGWRAIVLLAIAFYLLAFAFGPLRPLLHVPRMPFNTRNGPFFGLLFVTIGAWLRTRDIRITLPVALALFAFAGLLQLVEVGALVAVGAIEFPRFTDDTLTTIPFGVAAFLVALAIPASVRLPRLLARLAELSLGLYVVHLLFLSLWAQVFGIATLAASLGNAALAVGSSVVLVLILDEIPLTRRLIR